MPLGLYLSVPFCRTKCTYCNFASDVFSRAVFRRYVDRVSANIAQAEQTSEKVGGRLEPTADSIYLGGGTPTVLDASELERLLGMLKSTFDVSPQAEATVECAPGTLSDGVIETFRHCGVNRVSLGVQSFIDREAAAVGRLHKCATVLDDIARLRAAGISNINVDLIAGLPHQTSESWELSLAQVIALEVPHVSVYMLEIDEDSRLGRELIAGGTKYHAHFVPDEDLTADLYEAACERLGRVGIEQYEISNFARPGWQSQHNLKYWTRQPYFGFGVDAHSMLPRADEATEAVRFSTPDVLDLYVSGGEGKATVVSREQALEEAFFLGLRLNCGVDLNVLHADFGRSVEAYEPAIAELRQTGLVNRDRNIISLTARGRLLSNEVFGRFLLQPHEADRNQCPKTGV